MRRNVRLAEKDKLALLEQFKEAFPGNPTLWEYFMKNELGLDWKKANGYAVYPRLLAQNESWDSVDAYMLQFLCFSPERYSGYGWKVPYGVKTREFFFKNWLKFYKRTKSTGR